MRGRAENCKRILPGSRRPASRLDGPRLSPPGQTSPGRALRPAGPLDRPEEIEGACLESLVYQEIRALNDYLGFAYELFFWRTATGAEVDFVAYGESGILAIEVKRSRRLAKTDLAGMSLFRSDYPSPRCVVLYGGERHQYQEGIELIPLKEGLQDLAETLRDPSPAR
jgi:hypothetical protein